MRTRAGRGAVALVVIVGSLFTGGCTETSCSAVLFLDAVVIHLDSSAQTDDLATLRACVGTTCGENPIDRSLPDQSIAIDIRASQVTVSVTGRNGAGRQVFAGSTAVTTVVTEPDGPGCQSIRLAKVTISPAGLRPTA